MNATSPLISDFQASFDLASLAASLPAEAETMLVDLRLTDEASASSRIFRIYRPLPQHFHKNCDEHLLVLSGRARFQIGGQSALEVRPGLMQFFRRGVVHGFPEILEHPFVIFSIDTPRRDPSDIHFVNPQDGTPETFVRTISGY